jgi:glycosyltransferase involved in cell wall biosynthesis
MKVSVVVPNHGRDLTKLKASVNGSAELVIIDRGLERSAQRNIGIREADGDIILWLDSDQSVSPGLIQECKELIQSGYSCVYIPEIIVAKSFFGRIRKFEREFYTGTAIDVPRAVLKKACPMFDETMNGPEDADFGNRIKGFRAISKNPLYHHDDISFREYIRKKAYYSKSMKRYAEKWKDDKCLNLKYRCWTVFTENGKWKKLLKNPILSLGILFVIAVRGVIYYANK